MNFRKKSLVNLASLSLASFSLACNLVWAQNLENLSIDDQDIERIIVRGALSATPLSEMASSISVLDTQAIEQRHAQHLETLLNRAANVNFASGASRGRFVQIRGIGERSQFTDPINPSVGYLVDGINYSGLLAGASTFDIEQVEIFKGPNSARFGADGLAGMINVLSKDASAQTSFDTQFGIANYASWHVGAATGGQLSDTLNYRLSVHQNSSDGFVENTWLNLKDTNGIDELTSRAKLNWQATDDLTIKSVIHIIDVDNGYDVFSLNRDRTTLSDQPGFDTQKSEALAITSDYQGLDWADLQLQVSYMQADLGYGFDEDWGYVGISPYDPINDPDGNFAEYSSIDYYFRNREDSTIQGKLASKSHNINTWVIGFYLADKTEDLNREYTWLSSPFVSQVDRIDSAIFGQYKHFLSDKQWFTTSLRLASQSLDYFDSSNISQDLEHSDWGAEISYHQKVADNSMIYLSLLRSYKMGGVNGQALGKIDDEDIVEFRQDLLNNAIFDAESLVGIEFGIKGANQDGSLVLDFTTFYQKRDDVQYKNSIVNEQSFVDFYNNAADGKNYGIEVSLNYILSDNLDTFFNIGYLNTEISGITRQDGSTINKRDQAHAPSYHINGGLNWRILDNLNWLIEIDAKDDFFYSFSHDQQSDNIFITHTSLDYRLENWNISFYARNVFDKQYANRGFYFGNDPRDGYVTHLYEQFGEPRRIGIDFKYQY